MSGFVNRNAINANQKRLEVVNLEYASNGDLTELIVNELRNDVASCEGTKFCKKDMEKAIRDMIYNQIYGISFGDGTSDVNISSGLSVSKTISNNGFYCCGKSSINYDVQFNDNSTSYTVTLKNNPSAACDIDYYFDVYVDPGHEYLAFRVYGAIHYTPSSSDPND